MTTSDTSQVMFCTDELMGAARNRYRIVVQVAILHTQIRHFQRDGSSHPRAKLWQHEACWSDWLQPIEPNAAVTKTWTITKTNRYINQSIEQLLKCPMSLHNQKLSARTKIFHQEVFKDCSQLL
nr:hypothetical protein [Myxosarcina sp. GI1]